MDKGLVRLIPSFSWQRWFVLGLILLVLALSVQYCIKAGNSKGNRSAILRWRDQIHHLADEDIYQRYAYPNPPIMALLLEPIAHLPPLVGSLTWFYLKLAMAGLAVFWVFRIVASSDQHFPAWAKALAILLSLRPIMGDLSHGNVNLFILFLVVGSLYAFHRGRDYTAGIALALGIACKVTPALFLPYFLWKRAWKSLAGCTAGLVLFLLIIPGTLLGGERNLQLLDSWVKQMITPFVVAGTVTSDHPNQSLPGLVFRMTTESPSYLDEKGAPLRFDNLVTLNHREAGWIIKSCMALFAVMILWSCRTPIVSRHGWRLAAEFSLVVLGMLLFSERTWKHHCVTLILPFAVISYYLAICRGRPLMRCYLVGSLLLAFLLMTSTSTTGLLEPLDEIAKRAQVYGAYLWANLVLVAALVVMLRRTDPVSLPAPDAAESEQPGVVSHAFTRAPESLPGLAVRSN
ncbi:MAG TPA: glycosyltransferase family 87 protein [Gemmataceae bacterium]|nr:glycosyltransferase family 87 protein [Gemmataceae bacterium]